MPGGTRLAVPSPLDLSCSRLRFLTGKLSALHWMKAASNRRLQQLAGQPTEYQTSLHEMMFCDPMIRWNVWLDSKTSLNYDFYVVNN